MKHVKYAIYVVEFRNDGTVKRVSSSFKDCDDGGFWEGDGEYKGCFGGAVRAKSEEAAIAKLRAEMERRRKLCSTPITT